MFLRYFGIFRILLGCLFTWNALDSPRGCIGTIFGIHFWYCKKAFFYSHFWIKGESRRWKQSSWCSDINYRVTYDTVTCFVVIYVVFFCVENTIFNGDQMLGDLWMLLVLFKCILPGMILEMFPASLLQSPTEKY